MRLVCLPLGMFFQSRTDRIVFKLFGKDPDDLPHDLRKQVISKILAEF